MTDPDESPSVSETSPPSPEQAPTTTPTPAGAPVGAPELSWLRRIHRDASGWLAKRGWSSIRLVLVALIIAGLSSACFALAHPGVGALLAIPAIVLAWFSRPESRRRGAQMKIDQTRKDAFVSLLSEGVPLALIGGMILDAASDGSSFRTLILLIALGAVLLLALTRALDATEGRLPEGPTLWSWAERLLVLALGALMGKTGIAVFLVAGISVFDLLMRLSIMRSDNRGEEALPLPVRGLVQPSGEVQAGVRIATLLATFLLFVILPTASDWRW